MESNWLNVGDILGEKFAKVGYRDYIIEGTPNEKHETFATQ